ncbi:MAG: hypothetical protein ABFS12_00805 [Bacteroidota bacterium]
MSWDCPHLSKDICKLNGITCKPAKGNCVLRGKFEIMSSPKPPWEKKNENSDSKEKFKNL